MYILRVKQCLILVCYKSLTSNDSYFINHPHVNAKILACGHLRTSSLDRKMSATDYFTPITTARKKDAFPWLQQRHLPNQSHLFLELSFLALLCDRRLWTAIDQYRNWYQPTDRVLHVVCNTLTLSGNYHSLFLRNSSNINILTQNVHIKEFNKLIKKSQKNHVRSLFVITIQSQACTKELHCTTEYWQTSTINGYSCLACFFNIFRTKGEKIGIYSVIQNRKCMHAAHIFF